MVSHSPVNTRFFVDTSALAKRYLNEPGSAWVLSWIVPSAGNIIFVSELILVELRSLLMRHVRDGVLTSSDTTLLYGNLLAHLRDEYIPVLIDTSLLKAASDLIEKYMLPGIALRPPDAIQLAAAIRAEHVFGETITFISGDNRLLAAAAAEGFATDDPYQHP